MSTSTDDSVSLRVWTALVVGYAIFRAFRPIRYTDDVGSLIKVVAEVGLHVVAVVATGGWESPLIFTLLTAVTERNHRPGWVGRSAPDQFSGVLAQPGTVTILSGGRQLAALRTDKNGRFAWSLPEGMAGIVEFERLVRSHHQFEKPVVERGGDVELRHLQTLAAPRESTHPQDGIRGSACGHIPCDKRAD